MIYQDIIAAEHIDTRDVIEAWRELVGGDEQNPDPELVAELDEDEQRFIAAARELEDAGIEDFPYGAQMIREDCFEDHARELAEDIGALPADNQWPASYIDWPAAAQALKADYTTVDFLGHTYYVR